LALKLEFCFLNFVKLHEFGDNQAYGTGLFAYALKSAMSPVTVASTSSCLFQNSGCPCVAMVQYTCLVF
jgi:hypothetical protein